MNKKSIIFCAAVWACATALGQTKPNATEQDSVLVENLDEVVVTDSRFALKRENSGKTVIKITQEQLQHFQGQSVANVINSLSGFEIGSSRGFAGNVLGVYARGGTGRQTLVLIDGVRVGDPSSASREYDLQLLDVSTIESIEILKGAASTLYGSNAATAVISITTKKASKEKIGIQVATNWGTNNATDYGGGLHKSANTAQIGGTLNKFNYNLSVANTYTKGLSANVTSTNQEDIFNQFNANLTLGYAINDKMLLTITGNNTKVKSDYDNWKDDAANKRISNQKRVGFGYQYKYKVGTLILNGGVTDYLSKYLANQSTLGGKSYVLDLYNKLTIGKAWHTIVGVNHVRDEVVFSETKQFTITDPYINTVFISDFGLNLNAGARLNLHSEYGSNVVYNINPSYVIKEGDNYLKFISSYATSYITPSLTQLFGNFGANADLEPENNRTIEVGAEVSKSKALRASVVYFNRKEENAVIYDGANGGYVNATGIIDAQGVEVELQWQFANNFNVLSNYTFTERKGDNAIRIPKHKINASLNYSVNEATNFALNYSYTGDRKDSDFSTWPASDIALKPYSLINLSASHQLNKKIRLYANVTNVFNTEFVEYIGYTTLGRNFNFGATLKL